MSEFISQLNQIGGWFCDHASAMLLQVSVLIAILFVLDVVLRRHVRAVVRYWLWMLVLVKLFLPVSLSSPTGLAYWLPRGRPEVELSRREIGVGPVTTAVSAPPVENEGYARPYPNDGLPSAALGQGPPEVAPEGAASIVAAGAPTGIQAPDAPALPSWQSGLFLGWLAGILFLGIWVVRRSRFVRRLVRQAEPADRQIVQILDDCRARLQVRRPVKLGISADTTAPAVCGLLRPTILLPAGFSEQVSARQLKAVLMHELAHVQRGDLAVNLIQTVLQVVYFYNPLLWLANTMIRRLREKATDEAVLVALGEEAPQYSSTLIDVAERVFRRPVPGLSFVGVAESRRALAGRIRHIVSRPIPRTARLGAAGFACIIAVAATLLPMAAAEPAAAIAPEGDEGLSATSTPTDDASDLAASRPRKPIGPVPPYGNRAEGKLEFDKRIVLRFPNAQIARNTLSIVFSNHEGRIRGALRGVLPGPGETWWMHIELRDNAGKVVAADEHKLTNEQLVILLHGGELELHFYLGSWEDRAAATHFAVTIEQLRPFRTRQLKMQPGRSVGRQQPAKLSEGAIEPVIIDLTHPSGTAARWMHLTHDRRRLRCELHVSHPSGPKAAWKVGVRLLDEAGKTLAEGERRFENDGLVRDHRAFVRLKAFDFYFGKRNDISNIKLIAVTLEQLRAGENSATAPPVFGAKNAEDKGKSSKPAETRAHAWCRIEG
ncbi:MAG: M56 family metallopeptidase, partial [Planctomycetota bacterium]